MNVIILVSIYAVSLALIDPHCKMPVYPKMEVSWYHWLVTVNATLSHRYDVIMITFVPHPWLIECLGCLLFLPDQILNVLTHRT